MRRMAISLLALVPLSGCWTIHAHVPETAVHHFVREEGADIGAICSQDGRTWSEGARVCMAGRSMACDATGRWTALDDGC